jgi:LytS/YehU family sensor histidine kinase
LNNTYTISISPFLILGVVISICVGIIIWYKIRLGKEKKLKQQIQEKYNELEMKVQSLELENIKYKLNPHLFKNTLNSIQSHAYKTYYTLDKLSNVLDFILYESERQFVSVKEEVDFSLSLIEINRLKLSPLFDLRIKNKVGEQNPFFEQQLVAPLITVDLIENAFKHADLQSDNAFISIVFELKDDVFSLTVSNRINKKPILNTGKGGFGKQNFQKRLAIIYKDNYKLDQFIEDDIYISHLKINLLEHKAQMLAIG